ALQARACRSRRGVEADAVVRDSELEMTVWAGQLDGGTGGRRVLGDVLQGLEDAEVGRGLGVPAVTPDAVRFEQHRDRNPVGVRAQRGAQSLLGQQRRVDAAGERTQVLERGAQAVLELDRQV